MNARVTVFPTFHSTHTFNSSILGIHMRMCGHFPSNTQHNTQQLNSFFAQNFGSSGLLALGLLLAWLSSSRGSPGSTVHRAITTNRIPTPATNALQNSSEICRYSGTVIEVASFERWSIGNGSC